MCAVMDERARFERLYREHAARIRAYARRRLSSQAIADDVVSDVFLVVWRRLDEVPDDPLPWLYGIARRSLANRRRSDARASALLDRIASGRGRELGCAPDRDSAPGDGSCERDLDADSPALRALAQLSPADRELLALVAWEELEPAQLATALDAAPGTVAVRLHRARRRFAAALAAQDNLNPTPTEAAR